MLIDAENFEPFVDIFMDPYLTELSFDTETTGIRPYHGDRLFSLILANKYNTYYLNFFDYGDDTPVLSVEDCKLGLQKIFGREDVTKIAHNIKFDLAMLANEGIEVKGVLHDTMVMERSLDSTLYGKGVFSLAGTAKRYGHEKDDAVEKYINEHKLSEKVKEEWRSKETEHRFYYKVPPKIIVPYGETDARVTLDIHNKQMDRVAEMFQTLPNAPSIIRLVDNERELTRAVYDMECHGIRINRDYCLKAYTHDEEKLAENEAEFLELTGRPWEISEELLCEVFKDEKVVMTQGENPRRSFQKWVLEDYEHPAAQIVLNIRRYKKKLDTFAGLLYSVNDRNIVHTQLNQHLPWTGRFSSSNPNLQNMDKDRESIDPYPIRKAIVPRNGHMFYMIDYEQMEYRLMLDMAGQLDLIEEVNSGLDVHTATAKAVGIDRFQAKTANFAILYGAGINTLSKQTGLSYADAKKLREDLMAKLPDVARFIKNVRATARRRGFVFNWLGRRQVFPDRSKSYKAVNALIQGTCADTVKKAMNGCHRFLAGHTTNMILCIHDELVFEAPIDTPHSTIDECVNIMESAYPYKHLPLTVSVDHSYDNLAEKIVGMPGEFNAAGDEVQTTCS